MMNTVSKTFASGVLLSILLSVVAYFGLNTAGASGVNASTGKAVKLQAAQVEYIFASNGIMVGSQPSPLEIVQVTRNNSSLPVGGVFRSDMDLLSVAELRIKNKSQEKIKSARLTIDWIDPQASRTFATMCGLEVNDLAAGDEVVGKATTISAENMRVGFAKAGREQQRLLIRVDTVELTNDTLWQYGVMHRKDQNSPGGWSQISQANRNKANRQNIQVHNANFKRVNGMTSVSAFSICAYWKGFAASYPTYCASCDCNIWNDAYDLNDPQPNGFDRFLFDYIDQGCGGYGWWECPGCQKLSIISYSC